MSTPAVNSPEITKLTQGLGGYTAVGPGAGPLAIVKKGLSADLLPAKPSAQGAVIKVVDPAAPAPLPGAGKVAVIALPSTATVIDANGKVVTPSSYIALGGGKTLTFDPATFAGHITSTMATGLMSKLSEMSDAGLVTYTGSDCRVLLEVAEPTPGTKCSKQLMELSTITVSIHRVKSPAVAAGFIGAKGYSRGRRTVAGTMILTKFTADVLVRFLQSGVFRDLSKDSYYMKVDQLPPFNISMLFCDEYGHTSYQRLLGVEFVTDGSVYSIQDMMTEQTVSYVAADFTPLLPLTAVNFFRAPNPQDRKVSREKTPGDLWNAPTVSKA